MLSHVIRSSARLRGPTGPTCRPERFRPLGRLAATMLVLAGCSVDRTPSTVSPSGGPSWSVQTEVATSEAGTAAFDLEHALELMRRKGFTAAAQAREPKGPLRAFQALCTGTANGRCQAVFFFYEQKLVHIIQAGFVDIVAQDGDVVQISLPQYRRGDAGCCPSDKPSRHSVTMKNGTLQVEPPIPLDPNNYGDS